MNLARTSVFFDFDGTISTKDIGVHLLEQLAAGDWRVIGDAFGAGTIGSRACMEQEWACIPMTVDEATRRAVAAEVPLDPGFGPLVKGLRAAGAEVAVVSDGFGFYVRDRIAPFGVPVFTNDVDFTTNTMGYPHARARCDACGACGTCKPAVLAEAKARGRTTVFVGDGISDRHAARVADVVFATAALATWCDEQRIAFHPFDDLATVMESLLG